MTNRLFISLDLPEYIQDEVIRLRNEIFGIGSEKVKWEAKEKLHITIKFLGEVDNTTESKVQYALQSISGKYSSFSLEFSEFGMFFRQGVPSILWMGINDNSLLNNLKKDIENELSKLNFKKESRNFHPHITLLRLKGRENMTQINHFLETKPKDFTFNSNTLSLIKSELLPSGSIYKPVKSFKLL